MNSFMLNLGKRLVREVSTLSMMRIEIDFMLKLAMGIDIIGSNIRLDVRLRIVTFASIKYLQNNKRMIIKRSMQLKMMMMLLKSSSIKSLISKEWSKRH